MRLTQPYTTERSCVHYEKRHLVLLVVTFFLWNWNPLYYCSWIQSSICRKPLLVKNKHFINQINTSLNTLYSVRLTLPTLSLYVMFMNSAITEGWRIFYYFSMNFVVFSIIVYQLPIFKVKRMYRLGQFWKGLPNSTFFPEMECIIPHVLPHYF